MKYTHRCLGASLRASLLAGSSLGLLYASTAGAQETIGGRRVNEHIYVEGQQENYKIDTSGLDKLTQPLLDTPQSIDTISGQILQDQAISNLNDALKNVPGITIGAGEFRSIGTSPTIRGFSARSDMFLDGIRDYGDYYRDPFNLESIEVLEGPSSILFGRGSTGGVIEQNSKLPTLNRAMSGMLTFGTDATRRAVVDVDEPLEGLGQGTAFRITAMGHDADVSGRDVVNTKRYGFAPSLSLGLGTPTRLTVAYYHLTDNDIPDYGLPYFGSTPAAVPRNNFYGFGSDYMNTETDVATIKFEHDFSDHFTIENQARYANYWRDFRFTEPLIAATIPLTTPLSGVAVTRNVNQGHSDDSMWWDQLVAKFKLDTGAIHHDLVIGIEGGREKAAPEFFNNTGVPTTNLLTPNEGQQFAATTTFLRYQTHLIGHSVAPFAVDTAKLGSQWELTAGVRWDYFHVDYNDVNYSATVPGLVTKTDAIPHTDSMPSYRGALVYKPATNGSIYFSFGTSFNPSAEDLSLISSSRSFSLNNAQLDPEKNKTFEVGTKWDLFEKRLNLSGSAFRLQKDNARVPDPTNVLLNILAGSQRVDGFEVRADGHITPNWQVIAGYTYLDDKVTKTAPGAAPVGSPLMNTPTNALNFWSVYTIQKFEFGGGGRYVGSQYTQNVPPIKTVPGFWTFEVMGKYALTERVSFQVNVNNLFNKFYYDQLHFFHVVPGESRTALFSLNIRY